MAFGYSPQIVERFPGIRGGVVHATGLANGSTPKPLRTAYEDEQAKVRRELGESPLSEIPGVAAWRRAFTAFGVKPTKYRNAVESLLRRLTKHGDIPSINTLVDMANLVSIRHRMPVAVFDQSQVTGATTVRFATGAESFTDLGSDTPTSPEEGEVIFVDEASVVSARRWCWRQSAQSAASLDTVEALITIEGQHEGAEEDVRRATDHLVELLARFQHGAEVSQGLLSPEAPRFEF